MMKYVVVYEAGYVGEYDVEEFPSFMDALCFMSRELSKEDIEKFHIDIALDIAFDGESKRTVTVHIPR
jgi:hypothetical protein